MKKILVADDDAAICDALQFMLEDEGFIVYTTSDSDTIKTLRKEMPDLLLLDIWMSGEDGRDICKTLKADKKTANIPVILVSASRNLARSAKIGGANDFIAKPFTRDELISKIYKYI